MKEYTRKPDPKSRTLDNNPKAFGRAPIDVILQRYKEKNFMDEEKEPRQSVINQESIQRKVESNNVRSPDNLKKGANSDNLALQGKWDSKLGTIVNVLQSLKTEYPNANIKLSQLHTIAANDAMYYSIEDIAIALGIAQAKISDEQGTPIQVPQKDKFLDEQSVIPFREEVNPIYKDEQDTYWRNTTRNSVGHEGRSECASPGLCVRHAGTFH